MNEFIKALRDYIDARTFYRHHLNDMKAMQLEQKAEQALREVFERLLLS